MGDTNLEAFSDADFLEGFNEETPTDVETEPESAPAAEEDNTDTAAGETVQAGETENERPDETGSVEKSGGDTIRVQFLHEEREIPIDEARSLIQKGMNYDHVVRQRDEKFTREMGVIDRFANLSGMTREQYIEYMEQNAESIAQEKELRDLREKHPEASEETLLEMARLRLKENEAGAKNRAEDKKKAEDEAARKPWVDLFKRYPDVKADQLPKEVLQRVSEGMSPTEAYQAFLLSQKMQEIQSLKDENAAKQHNQKIKEKALGSMQTEQEPEEDEFLAGFLG